MTNINTQKSWIVAISNSVFLIDQILETSLSLMSQFISVFSQESSSPTKHAATRCIPILFPILPAINQILEPHFQTSIAILIKHTLGRKETNCPPDLETHTWPKSARFSCTCTSTQPEFSSMGITRPSVQLAKIQGNLGSRSRLDSRVVRSLIVPVSTAPMTTLPPVRKPKEAAAATWAEGVKA